MPKPDHALHELDREPIVHFGCTWSEIKRCTGKAFVAVLPMTLMALLTLRLAPLLCAAGLLAWLGLTRFFIYRIHRNRAGKPLHFEQHQQAIKRLGAPFISAQTLYQSQRTRPSPARRRTTRWNRRHA